MNGQRSLAVFAVVPWLLGSAGLAWSPCAAEDTASVDECLRRLRDTDPDVRAEAAERLGVLGDARAAEALVPLLGDDDEEVRRAAFSALYQLPCKPFPTQAERNRLALEPDPWHCLSLRVELEKSVCEIGEPLTATLVLHNRGAGSIPVPKPEGGRFAADERQWDLVAWRAEREAPGVPRGGGRTSQFVTVSVVSWRPENARAIRARALYACRRELAPGKEARFRVDLIDYLAWWGLEKLPLCEPGEYLVRAAFNPRPYLLSPGQLWIASEPVHLRLTPPPAGEAVAHVGRSRWRGRVRWARVVNGQRTEWLDRIEVRTREGGSGLLSCDLICRLDIDNPHARPVEGFSNPYHVQKIDGGGGVVLFPLECQPFIETDGRWRALPLLHSSRGEWHDEEWVETIIIGRGSP